MNLASSPRAHGPEANLNSVASRARLLDDWEVFDQISQIESSDFADLEAIKIFCVLASDYYRALNEHEGKALSFKEFCETNLALAVAEVSSGKFSPHRVLKELKFIDPHILSDSVFKKRLIMRLAIHQPQKTVESGEAFEQLCLDFLKLWELDEEDQDFDPEEELRFFKLIRENIDFYGHRLSLKTLSSLDGHCQESRGNGNTDLKIDRQHDETLWYLQLAGMDEKTLNVFASIVYALEPYYRGRARKYETATHASEPDAGFNHLLRCIDIDMGMWIEANERGQKAFYADLPQPPYKRSLFLLEEALTVLLHDALEDANPQTKSKTGPIRGLNGEEMNEVTLINLLLENGVSTDMAIRLVRRSQLLDKKKGYEPMGETQKPASYYEYLDRIFRSGDEFSMRAKIVDFFQNSQTDLAKDPAEWKPEVRDKCEAWRIIFDRQPGLIKVLASIVSPIVVLRWQQFYVSGKVNAVLKEEKIGWLANFQRNVVDRQDVSATTIRADLMRAA